MKKLFITTLLFTVAYGLAVGLVFSKWDAKLQSQHDDHLYRLERFIDESGVTPEGVVVGTSLGARLGLEQGKNGVYDLSLSGGSIYTGLEMILALGRKPKTVFIETNLLEKEGDPKIISEAQKNWGKYLQIFRTRYTPINVFCSFLARIRPPADFVSNPTLVSGGIASQMDKYGHPIEPKVIDASLERLKKVVSTLESGGTTVVFFEMPISDALASTSRVQQLRSVMAKEFPNHKQILLQGGASPVSVETTDGTHLSSRDVARIRPLLEKQFAEAIAHRK